MNRELLLAVIVGIVLFLSDFTTSWLTSLSAHIPVIFIMAIIIGIIAGKHTDGLFATGLTWVISIPLGMLITPLVYSEYVSQDTTLFGLFLFVPIWTLRGTFNFQLEGNVIEALVTGLVLLMIIILLAPAIYVTSLIFGLLGGWIGHVLRGFIHRESQLGDISPDERVDTIEP